jgi:hypothetical protein
MMMPLDEGGGTIRFLRSFIGLKWYRVLLSLARKYYFLVINLE